MSKKVKNTHYTYKSAKTGEFVTKEYADKHKATTFREKTNNPKKKKK